MLSEKPEHDIRRNNDTTICFDYWKPQSQNATKMVYAMAIMSVSDCRRYLHGLNDKFTDNQVKQIRDALIPMVNYALHEAKRRWKK